MKQVIIVVPNGYADLSSLMGSLEILSRANEYWQKLGNPSLIEIHVAGFVRLPALRIDHPMHLRGTAQRKAPFRASRKRIARAGRNQRAHLL